MRLKNKKTGEIGEIGYIGSTDGSIDVNPINRVACETIASYNSLAELNEEWCDFEEPKEYWYIDWTPKIGAYYTRDIGSDADERQKEIGNYFETKEEAEKAVEKLKAWKRLKDKGFRFEGWDNTDRSTIHNFSLFVAIEDLDSINKDLDLLFGGEE